MVLAGKVVSARITEAIERELARLTQPLVRPKGR
jgi:hypothetical protein